MEQHIRLDQARDLISQGELHLALEELRNFLSGFRARPDARLLRSSSYNEALLQLSRLARATVGHRTGTTSNEDYERGLANITAGTLELINKIERSHTSGIMPVSEQPIRVADDAIGNPEIVLGSRSQLKSLAWLREGLHRARSVCRVVSPIGVGTGFVMNTNTLVTNNHVLRTPLDAASAEVEFNFEEDLGGKLRDVVRYKLDAERFFTSKELDCTAVKIRPGNSPEGVEQWGELQAETATTAVSVLDHVTIIQHPSGGIKQICVTDNRVIKLFGNFIQYTTDTMSGSSGSPVFNDGWRVVAIHHMGGNLVKGARGGGSFANQGVLMSSIMAEEGFSNLLRRSS